MPNEVGSTHAERQVARILAGTLGPQELRALLAIGSWPRLKREIAAAVADHETQSRAAPPAD